MPSPAKNRFKVVTIRLPQQCTGVFFKRVKLKLKLNNMKLEQLWLHAFNKAVKNGYTLQAVKIANEAVAGWRESGLLINLEQWQGETLVGVDAKAMQNFTEAISPVERKPFEPMFEEANGYTKEELENIEANLRPQDTGGIAKTITVPLSTFHEQDQPEPKCGGNCDMNYCDDNGCIERKRNLVEDVPCKPEQPQKFYWKPVSEFTEEDAVRHGDDCLVVMSSHDLIYSDYKQIKSYIVKYLARCKEDKGDFVPCWEWAQSKTFPDRWENDTVEYCVIIGPSSGRYYYRYKSDSSSIYPTLEAAKYEAERYYRLYIEPNETK